MLACDVHRKQCHTRVDPKPASAPEPPDEHQAVCTQNDVPEIYFFQGDVLLRS